MQSTTTANYTGRFDLSRIPQTPALLGAAFALLIVIVLISMTLMGTANRERDRLLRTIDTQTRLDELLASVRRMESGQRGYLLTGDPQFLLIYNDTLAGLDARIGALEEAVKENADQEAALERLRPLIDGKRKEMSDSLLLHDSGRNADAVALVREGQGMRYMDNIRGLIGQMRSDQAESRRTQYEAAVGQERWLMGINTIAVALILLLAGTSVFMIQRANAAMLRAQQVLRDANSELEANVAARTAELTAANEEIQKFAYIVSHDLRSPLVNIMGFTSEIEMLKGDLLERLRKVEAEAKSDDAIAPPAAGANAAKDAEIEKDFDEALSFIKASITKMDRLINAVLTISREGNRNLQPETIDLNDMFKTITLAVAHQAQEADAGIEVGTLPSIVSDRLALEQIFSNLVDNALKYLRRDVKGQVSVSGSTKGKHIVLEVRDNGRGIDTRDQTRVFELFRRAGVQDRPGEGMGLAHVRALVRRIGGSIHLESTPGEGSVFRVILPRTLPNERKRTSA